MIALRANLVLTIVILGMLAHLAATAPKPITILRASPAMAFAPADLRVEVKITPDQENRAVVVVCDGPSFYRSSGWTVEGDRGPSVFSVDWRELPAGNYDVVAVVQSATQERGRATATVTRMGS